MDDSSRRLIYWRIQLSGFDFDVKYKKGIVNCQADALYRFKKLGETRAHEDDDVPCLLVHERVGSWTTLRAPKRRLKDVTPQNDIDCHKYEADQASCKQSDHKELRLLGQEEKNCMLLAVQLPDQEGMLRQSLLSICCKPTVTIRSARRKVRVSRWKEAAVRSLLRWSACSHCEAKSPSDGSNVTSSQGTLSQPLHQVGWASR